MFEFLENNHRKYIRESFLNQIDKTSKKFIQNNYIRGYIFCIIHILLVLIPFLFIIFSNNLKIVIFSQIILISILFQHFYFDGCWMIRLERKIWNTKEWYGLWTYLFYIIESFGFKLHRDSRDNIFFVVYSIIIGFGFYRIIKIMN